MSNCLFCAIAAGSIAADRVLDEDQVVAFLDTRPVFKGHTLLVPRIHVATLPDLNPEAVPTAIASTTSTVRAL